MASKNVEALRAAHESWNRRDYEGLVRNIAENFVYTDHATQRTLKNRNEFRRWTEDWAKSTSDGKITNAKYIDAGDVVIAEFTAEGTNDGPFFGLRSTGRRMSLPLCEIWRCDSNGRFVEGAGYYDMYSILTQLGHVQPLRTAA